MRINIIETYNPKKCPCRDCKKRKVACHSKCHEYIEWKEENDRLRKIAYFKRYGREL